MAERTNHLSASSIASFKACPTRYRLAYVEGLRPAVDTESQRMGTNWHAMHEVWANAGLQASDASVQGMALNLSTEEVSEIALRAVIEHLNERYKEMPAGFDKHKWELERQILLTSFIGYQWYWQNDPIEFLASEVPFNLPLHLPRSGMPLPMSEVQRVGKIDHVIRWHGAVGALERKSTSRSIAPDSDYWDRSKKDTQVSMYALAFKDLFRDDGGGGGLIGVGTLEPGERFGNTLYDVFHKPTIKPCELTQKETAEFLESKTYYGQAFDVVCEPDSTQVNGVTVEVTQGKKAISIRETTEMYAARLLHDIQERPDFYFQRKEIVRTDAELTAFRRELYAIYQSQKIVAENGCWFSNESACRATYACPYIPVCYGAGADSVCDGRTTPPGMKRIFVDLTINGQEPEE